jgi:hypothetical protein
MLRTEHLASYVRTKFPYTRCHACMAVDFQTDEATVRERAQVLALRDGFRVNDGICSGYGRVKMLLEWSPSP